MGNFFMIGIDDRSVLMINAHILLAVGKGKGRQAMVKGKAGIN